MMIGQYLTDRSLIAAIVLALAAAVVPVVRQWIHSKTLTKIVDRAIQDATPDQRPEIIIAVAELMSPPRSAPTSDQAIDHRDRDPKHEDRAPTPRPNMPFARLLSRFLGRRT